MTTDIKSFEFCGLAVRTIVLDTDGWFLAQDVATLLEYDQTSNMTKRLDADEKRNYPIRSENGNYANYTLINLFGFLNLLFTQKNIKDLKFLMNFYAMSL